MGGLVCLFTQQWVVVVLTFRWGLMLPLGVLIARLTRSSDEEFMGKPAWFGYHRLLQSLGVLLQLGGFIAIVMYFNQNSMPHFSGSSAGHMLTGLFVVCIGSLQPLNAIFRPHVDEHS